MLGKGFAELSGWIMKSTEIVSLFLGEPGAVRLSGDAKNLTPYWEKDSAIFMEEVLAWLTR